MLHFFLFQLTDSSLDLDVFFATIDELSFFPLFSRIYVRVYGGNQRKIDDNQMNEQKLVKVKLSGVSMSSSARSGLERQTRENLESLKKYNGKKEVPLRRAG